jgi:hypothetical protein
MSKMKKKLLSIALAALLGTMLPMAVAAGTDDPPVETENAAIDAPAETENAAIDVPTETENAAIDTPAAADGDSWTDPETGYTYQDGVNVTVQGGIMLLSDETTPEVSASEAEPIAAVPKTGVPTSFPAALSAALAVLPGLIRKKQKNA